MSLTRACAVALALLAASAHAQPPRWPAQPLAHVHHTTWTEADGLPSGGVTGGIQRTPDGYLWLGAEDAVVRFDGVRFTRFDSTTTPALRSARGGTFRLLLVDRAGTLWVSRRDGGLVAYRGGAFRVVVPPGAHADLTAQLERADGEYWLLSGDDRLYSLRGGRLGRPALPAGVPDTGMLGLIPDTGAGVWMGSRAHGLWHVSGDRARHHPVPPGATDVSQRPLVQDRDGTLVVFASRDGLVMLRGERRTQIRPPGRDSGKVTGPRAVRGPDGALWVATRGEGMLRLRGGVVEQFTERDGLSDAVVRAVLADEEGSVWVATEMGLDRLRHAPFAMVSRRNGLPFDAPINVLPDAGGALWTVQYGQSLIHRLDGGIVRGEPGPVAVREIRPGAHGGFWPLGLARGGGLFVYDEDDRVVRLDGTRATVVTPRLPRRALHAREDGGGTLWLYLMPPLLGRWTAAGFAPLDTASIGPGASTSNLSVTSLGGDARGHVWVAVGDPAVVLELADGRVVRRVGAREGLTRAVYGLTPAGADTLWGNARDGTLVRIAAGAARTVAVPEVVPIARDQFARVVAHAGALWVAGGGGVARIPLDALNARAEGRAARVPVRLFGAPDGLAAGRGNRLDRDPVAVAPDGRLWFATPTGLAVLDPRVASTNPIAPRVHVEEVAVDGTPLPADARERIGPNPGAVDVRFTATALRMPERARVEYRMDGVDAEWQAARGARTARYTQLRPGRYRFRVRAWNEDGVPGRGEAVLALRVLPAWYQTPWAAAVGLAAVAGAAAEEGAELLALATHPRHGGVDRLLEGSVAAAVVHRAPCPVWLTHAP
ncbi:triple tyrosine motif-containing protein [Roseisolibacter sp. H3M3-2]|uniref:ligand-binding sensor domain-containing protein n=1 Tax=Roseisolibacter sp. H3M3-2 TaxID=3031323 RepID=UPI0023DC7AA9|nr:triple tyrosine motif-containing protein [Roseisolibacter sp. H3M3-2]MDF1505548.1 triple tyrosine motif-containing protein [Roseisolibacter sp. H3M3-2]